MKAIAEIIDIEKGRRELAGDRITVGVATCGVSAGARPTLERLASSGIGIPVEPVGCSGMCFNEPIVTVRQDGGYSIYAGVTEDKADALIAAIKAGSIATDLFVGHQLEDLEFYKKQHRMVMNNCGTISPLSIEQYAAQGGFTGLEKALKMTPAEAIQYIKDSKLRGRGGAGFPTGVKWGFVSGKSGKKFLIGNGDEGDPGAFMNRTILESDPYRVLEGMIIASYAIGADEAFVYTRAEYPLAIKTIQKAIIALKEKGLLGERILGKEGFNLEIRVKEGAGAFVCGEETALMRSMQGKRGYPKPRPPYPAEKGLEDYPTIINNVGTLAHVATIMQVGLDAYTSVGSDKSKGTKIICLAGEIRRPGVIEVPMGIPLSDIVEDIGGGAPEGTTFKAVQSGGPAGGCIPESELNTPLDYETLTAKGAIMGSGGLIVLNNEDCMVDVARYFMNFTQQESCGKCTPCREGNMRLLELLEKITARQGTEDDLKTIRRLANFVTECSLCGLGQNAPNPIISTMNYFMHEYDEHVKDKKCAAGVCKSIDTYTITDSCVGCGHCARICPVGAITGTPKQQHYIDQDTCTRCGECYRNCAFHSIEKSGRQ